MVATSIPPGFGTAAVFPAAFAAANLIAPMAAELAGLIGPDDLDSKIAAFPALAPAQRKNNFTDTRQGLGR